MAIVNSMFQRCRRHRVCINQSIRKSWFAHSPTLSALPIDLHKQARRGGSVAHDMATSDKTGKPDATTDVETVETMSLEAIQAELREPATASAVAQGEEHRA